MRIVDCEVDWEMGGRKLLAVEEYIIEDQSLTQVSAMARGLVNSKKYQVFQDKNLDPKHLNGKKVLLLRPGAAGDLLFMKPTIDKLINLGAEVTLTTLSHFRWIHKNSGCSWTEWPLKPEYIDAEFNYVYDLEYIDAEVKGKHPVDTFAKMVGIDLLESERIPKWEPDNELVQKMHILYPKKEGKKRIVVCVTSTTPVRDYPFDQFQKVCHELYKKGHEICFIGHSNSIIIQDERMNGKIVNLTQSGLSWEEQVIFIKTADCFIGGDSGNTHFAGAMGVPTVALYGSFHWKDRSGIFPSVKNLQGHGDCACCYFHPTHMNDWPKGKPCEKSKKCEVLVSIPINRIVNEVDKILCR